MHIFQETLILMLEKRQIDGYCTEKKGLSSYILVSLLPTLHSGSNRKPNIFISFLVSLYNNCLFVPF